MTRTIDKSKVIGLTGSEGFLGKNLLKLLHNSGYKTICYNGDIRDENKIKSFFSQAEQIDVLYHFAAISSPIICNQDQALALEINTHATRKIAEQLNHYFPRSIFIFPSTSQIYKNQESNSAIIYETSEVTPINFYAQTKQLAEENLKKIHLEFGLSVLILRLFNHSHKSQDPTFFLPSVYQQLLAKKNEIQVGNLDLIRDFGAVQDLLSAFLILLEINYQPLFEVYNICSGKGKNLKTLSQELADQMNRQVQWIVDPKRVRNNEPLSIVGNCTLFQNKFNWKPYFATDETQMIQSFLSEL